MEASQLKRGKIFLVAVSEDQYPDKIVDLLKIITNTYNKICYVCLHKPYADVAEDIKRIGLDLNKFFFIDVLTSHYRKPEPVKNCIFIKSPINLGDIGKAIKKAIIEEKCEEIFIDTISSLLVYHQGFYIVKFVHELKSGELSGLKDYKQSILVSMKEDPGLGEIYERLMKDLVMFADEVLELEKDKTR